MKFKKLDPRPARELTDRECAKIIGGTVGSLLGMAKPEDVRAAVQWVHNNFDAFVGFRAPEETR